MKNIKKAKILCRKTFPKVLKLLERFDFVQKPYLCPQETFPL
jgi:hypothetical protein